MFQVLQPMMDALFLNATSNRIILCVRILGFLLVYYSVLSWLHSTTILNCISLLESKFNTSFSVVDGSTFINLIKQRK